jgi:hypothetical protein
VKGFPIVVKITAVGEQTLPPLWISPFGTDIVISMVDNKDPQKKWTLKQVMAVEAEEKELALTRVNAGSTLSALLDLASLSLTINSDKEITMNDMPDGSYNVTIGFSFSTVTSNTFKLELRSPSASEKEFLECPAIRKVKYDVAWGPVLSRGGSIAELPFKKLGAEATQQMALHRALLDVVSASDMKTAKVLQDFKAMTVPAYLSDWKKLYELDLEWLLDATATNSKLDDFEKLHPSLSKSIKGIRDGYGYLSFKYNPPTKK